MIDENVMHVINNDGFVHMWNDMSICEKKVQ